MTSFRASVLAAGLALSLLGASSAGAAAIGLDHFKCYQAKDSAGKVKYSVDLTAATKFNPPFANAVGCVVKVPAKMICHPVTKALVTPQPPNVEIGFGPQLFGAFACYKVKCPKQQPFPAPIDDQFGNRSDVLVKAPNLLCTPAQIFFSGS